MSLSSSLSGEHLEQAEEAAVKMGLLSVADKADFDIEVTPKFPADTRNCKFPLALKAFERCYHLVLSPLLMLLSACRCA